MSRKPREIGSKSPSKIFYSERVQESNFKFTDKDRLIAKRMVIPKDTKLVWSDEENKMVWK